jgi:hypothetical protein
MSNAKRFSVPVGDVEDIIHCRSCLAWDRSEVIGGSGDEPEPESGECRRRSPQQGTAMEVRDRIAGGIIGLEDTYIWPVTMAGDWCLDAIRDEGEPV